MDNLKLVTDRLSLRPWKEQDFTDFYALHSDPVVMDDQGGSLTEKEIKEKFQRYLNTWASQTFGRWAVFSGDFFVGYVGVMHREEPHPLGIHDEIGWRLHPQYWGQGIATEAAESALNDVFSRVGLASVLAYTGATNFRSQKVMERLRFKRFPERDFTVADSVLGEWSGQVWGTRSSDWLSEPA